MRAHTTVITRDGFLIEQVPGGVEGWGGNGIEGWGGLVISPVTGGISEGFPDIKGTASA